MVFYYQINFFSLKKKDYMHFDNSNLKHLLNSAKNKKQKIAIAVTI